MLKTINALQVRRQLGQFLEEMFYKGTEFIIERGGKPMAAAIPLSEYVAYKKQKGEDTKALDEIMVRSKSTEFGQVEEPQ